MDLKNFDINGLTILWQNSDRNDDFKRLVEIELKERIANNTNFSREYFFEVCVKKNHVITISFIPTTESYINYGPHITVDVLFNDKETEEMTRNCSLNPPKNTTGQLRAKASIVNDLTEGQIGKLANSGFHTSEIYETHSFN